MNQSKIRKIIHILSKHTKQFDKPLMNQIIEQHGKDPFLLLIGCLLSLRTKDKITAKVCKKLFSKAKTPDEIIALGRERLEEIIFQAGFFKTKANVLLEVSRKIIDKHEGEVPTSIEELLKLKGVGRKTANLVAGLAFDIPAICVDIHVHRISNRLGIIKTKTAYESEVSLEKIVPKKSWITWNKLLVTWGQNICTPRTPRCRMCAIKDLCNYGKKHKARNDDSQ